MAAVDYFNNDPVVHTWTYKLDKLRGRTWDDLVEMIPLMIERLDDQDKYLREIEDRLKDVERGQ